MSCPCRRSLELAPAAAGWIVSELPLGPSERPQEHRVLVATRAFRSGSSFRGSWLAVRVASASGDAAAVAAWAGSSSAAAVAAAAEVAAVVVAAVAVAFEESRSCRCSSEGRFPPRSCWCSPSTRSSAPFAASSWPRSAASAASAVGATSA